MLYLWILHNEEWMKKAAVAYLYVFLTWKGSSVAGVVGLGVLARFRTE
jgi:hypothetical protein